MDYRLNRLLSQRWLAYSSSSSSGSRWPFQAKNVVVVAARSFSKTTPKIVCLVTDGGTTTTACNSSIRLHSKIATGICHGAAGRHPRAATCDVRRVRSDPLTRELGFHGVYYAVATAVLLYIGTSYIIAWDDL